MQLCKSMQLENKYYSPLSIASLTQSGGGLKVGFKKKNMEFNGAKLKMGLIKNMGLN